MRGSLVALVAVVGLVVVGAIGIVFAVTSSSTTALVDLEVGTCFELPDERQDVIERVVTVDCADPHQAEVVVVGSLREDGDPYPEDDEVLFAAVEAACRRDSPDVSGRFGLLPVAPSEELWESFEGRYLCVAIPFGGDPVTGSITSG